MPIINEFGHWKSIRDQKSRALQLDFKGLSPAEREVAEQILRDKGTKGKSPILDLAYQTEWDPETGPPVPIEEWINSEHYLGETTHTLYPEYKKDIIEIFNGGYSEVILCLHPDTRIPLLSGETKTLKELSENWKKDQTPFWVYGCKDEKIIPVLAEHPRKTGEDDYWKVTLDNGTNFVGNSKHQMVLRNGQKRMIQDMKPGDSLMPCDFKVSSKENGDRIVGYEKIIQPDGSEEFTHRIVGKNVEGRTKRKGIIHHVNFLKRNNTPKNLQWVDWEEHNTIHTEHSHDFWEANPEWAKKQKQRLKDLNKEWWEGEDNEEHREIWAEKGREVFKNDPSRAAILGKLAKEKLTEEQKKNKINKIIARNKLFKTFRDDVTLDSITQAKSKGYRTLKAIALYHNCSPNRVRKVLKDNNFTVPQFFGGNLKGLHPNDFEKQLLKNNPEGIVKKRIKPKKIIPIRSITLEQVKQAIREGAATQEAVCFKLNCVKETVKCVVEDHGLTWRQLKGEIRNHFVVSIEKVGHGDVYCMTVPETTNFVILPFGAKDLNEKVKEKLGSEIVISPCVVSSNTGSTRSGKNYIAAVCVMRLLYELLCSKNPQKALGLGAGERINFEGISHTKKAANDVIFSGIASKLNLAPFFQGKFKETMDGIAFQNKNIHIKGGASGDSAALGYVVFVALIDEANFLGAGKDRANTAAGAHYDRAEMVYGALERRIKGQFAKSGIKGMIFCLSSKKSPTDFIERLIQERIKEKDEKVFIRDRAIWQVRPEFYADQKWHTLLVSPKGGRSQVIPYGEEPPKDVAFIKFPEIFLREFLQDPDGAARDLAGIISTASNPFIVDRLAITDMMKAGRPSPFENEEWATDVPLPVNWKKTLTINAKGEPVPMCCPHAKRHAHLDLSKNMCSTGFFMGHLAGYTEVPRKDENGKEYLIDAPIVHMDCGLEIIPPSGGEIDHEKVRDLMVSLREAGYPLVSVSMDQWCHTPNAQLLRKKGFKVDDKPVSVISTLVPYIAARNILYERRIESPLYDNLKEELEAVELNKECTKIVKPRNILRDLADAFVGVCYYLTEYGNNGTTFMPTKGITENIFKVAPKNTSGAQYLGQGEFRWPDDPLPPKSKDYDDDTPCWFG